MRFGSASRSTAPRARQMFFTIEEAHAIAPGIPINSWHWAIQTGKLQSVRPGKRRLIHRNELARFLGIDPSEL